ncbi:MAG: hypothetical protein IT378_08640 [Sandaracinaceae bacterium]|nr:hypothetical protein [Sandaracinaceae bacterium]
MRAALVALPASFLAGALATLVAGAPIASTALAQPSGGWRDVVEPERLDARRMLEQALVHVLLARQPRDPELGDSEPWMEYERALSRLAYARRVLPDDPQALFLTAVALSGWQRDDDTGARERRTDEALDAWQALRREHPRFMPDRVAFELALLYTFRRDYARARAEYVIALRHRIPRLPVIEPFDLLSPQITRAEYEMAGLYAPAGAPTLHANFAEVSMLDGDLDAAVHHYEAALAASADDPVGNALARWGLSLALDRRGAHTDALGHAARALRADPVPADDPRFARLRDRHGAFAVLHLSGVFFEPPCEVHAYEALGHEALAQDPASGRSQEELRAALRSWRVFLTEGGNAARYADVARAHVARLERLLGEPAPPARRP